MGDYFDRGPDSAKVWKYLRELDESFRCIFLKGNHEMMLLDYLDSGEDTWLYNGYEATLLSFRKEGESLIEAAEWIREKTVPYFETDGFEVCHGGKISDRLSDNDLYDLVWDRSLAEEMVYDGKLLIVGHTPIESPSLMTGGSAYEYQYDACYPLPGKGLIDIDTGCVFRRLYRMKGGLTVMEIREDEMRFWKA